MKRLIPPLWAQLHRYDATKDYESARDRLLRAIGLSLPAAKAAPQTATLVRLDGRYVDIALMKTLDGLLSLSPQEFEDAVALMLTAHGYRDVHRRPSHDSADLRCRTLDGRATQVWCRRFGPDHLLNEWEVSAATATDGLLIKSRSSQAVIVTTSGYTTKALDLAKEYGITLIDGQQLVTMMQRVQPE